MRGDSEGQHVLAAPLARLARAPGPRRPKPGAHPGGAEQPGARLGGDHLDVPDDRAGRADEGHARVLETSYSDGLSPVLKSSEFLE